jgi:hypothetical protein
MSDEEPKKTIFDEVLEAFSETRPEAEKIAGEMAEGLTELKDSAVSAVEDGAFYLSEKREELWDRGQINDRLAGAAITGKFGILAGPLAKVAIPTAALYGFIKGPEIVDKHDTWLKKQRKKRKKDNDYDGPK